VGPDRQNDRILEMHRRLSHARILAIPRRVSIARREQFGDTIPITTLPRRGLCN
jgi:hypothetical protein